MKNNNLPLVSVIIPCRNEEKFIGNCLDSIIAQNYPGDKIEILVIDGMSEDDTKNILEKYSKKNKFIEIIENTKRITPVAMNIGIKKAKGDIIMRCDAHSEYPKNYISEIVEWHEKNLADNIGGVWDTVPGDNNKKAKAIALAMCHPIGVGFSYRTEKAKKEKFVDTVPFGSWKKNTLKEVGLFDENFIRAQDLEYNIRIKKMGKKILMLPWLKIKYYARENYKKLFKMFFQYGYWKNLVNRKHKILSSLRQVIPVLFVIVFLILALTSFFSIIILEIFITYNLIYLISLFLVSILIFVKEKNIILIPPLIWSFIIIHFSYGIGYIKGFMDIFILNKKRFKKALTAYTR